MRRLICLLSILAAGACAQGNRSAAAPPAGDAYFDNAGRDDVLAGGVKMIPITTPKGVFKVWTKRVGNSPTMKVLLLHGGPGATHEYMEAFDSYFPASRIEYYYYDQLGSAFSDQPDTTRCGSCRASSRKSNRCGARSASIATTSSSSASRGAACSPSNTR